MLLFDFFVKQISLYFCLYYMRKYPAVLLSENKNDLLCLDVFRIAVSY